MSHLQNILHDSLENVMAFCAMTPDHKLGALIKLVRTKFVCFCSAIFHWCSSSRKLVILSYFRDFVKESQLPGKARKLLLQCCCNHCAKWSLIIFTFSDVRPCSFQAGWEGNGRQSSPLLTSPPRKEKG